MRGTVVSGLARFCEDPPSTVGRKTRAEKNFNSTELKFVLGQAYRILTNPPK
jgi:hypothetical protein